MTIGKKIIGGYAVVLAIFAVVSICALFSLNQVQDKYNRIIDINGTLLAGINAIRFDVRNQVAHCRGFLLYADQRQRFQDALKEDYLSIDEHIRKMKGMVLSIEGNDALNRIADLQEKFEKGQDKSIAAMLQGKSEEALALGISEVRPISEALIVETDRFRDLQLKKMDARRVETVAEMQRNAALLVALSLLGFIFGLVISFYLSRTITGKLRETIAQLSSSAAEILAMTMQVASGSAETASAVGETTSTVEEVKQTVQLSTQKAKLVSENAQKTAQISESGQRAVQEMIEEMNHIWKQTASAADSIVKLSEQTQVIGEIIFTVNDLAEQSNLLAVNASIEAAKAGDHGKGFAVVAQEIKSLAEQSKQATAQVRAILGETQKAATAAVMATDLSGKAVEAGVQQSAAADASIRLLSESIVESAQAALQIASSSQQQMVGMDQVALAMENIKQASMQNMTGTRQAEVAARNLHDLGLKLKQLI